MSNALADIPTLGRKPERKPRNSLMSLLEELSIGGGYGIQNQLAGMADLVEHPVESAKAMYQSASHPVQTANALVDYGKQAFQSPMGAAQFIGEMANPRSLLTKPTMLGMATRPKYTHAVVRDGIEHSHHTSKELAQKAANRLQSMSRGKLPKDTFKVAELKRE
jgi:hypothetical protein